MKRLLAVSAFVATGLVALPALSQQRPAMTAHFIDVGQAHATLLEFPCGAMLIDAGTQNDEHETKLPGCLDADVLQVGHHGSCNATTSELLGAVTARVAVIPVGKWSFGRGTREAVPGYACDQRHLRDRPDGTVRVVARAENDITVSGSTRNTGSEVI